LTRGLSQNEAKLEAAAVGVDGFGKPDAYFGISGVCQASANRISRVDYKKKNG